MTALAWAALTAATVTAVLNWVAVAGERRSVEYVCKPATLALLVVAALALDPAHAGQRAWFVAALVLSLAGDVFLMLPEDRFVPGLVTFLLAHLAYVGGFVVLGVTATGLGTGLLVVAGALALVGRPLLGALRSGPAATLTGPVIVYLAAISAMVVAAFGTGQVLAVAGALLFYTSDSLIGWRRFVRPRPWMPVAVMVTYHLGQALLVLSLV